MTQILNIIIETQVDKNMARPKSEEKRLALLKAAAEIVAEQGLEATPTSQVAKRAGVAEGTLFRYFATKDELLNELYIYLNQDMCETLMKRYVSSEPFRSRVQCLWDSYIDWGLAHPIASKTVNQLAVSSVLTAKTHELTIELFPELEVCTSFSRNEVFAGREDFADAIFTALADTTMSFAAHEPENAESFKKSGFAALWKMYGDD